MEESSLILRQGIRKLPEKSPLHRLAVVSGSKFKHRTLHNTKYRCYLCEACDISTRVIFIEVYKSNRFKNKCRQVYPQMTTKAWYRVTCTICLLFWKMLKSTPVILSPTDDTGDTCNLCVTTVRRTRVPSSDHEGIRTALKLHRAIITSYIILPQ
jgi:hypothetical protein